jgi:hypothetical protein
MSVKNILRSPSNFQAVMTSEMSIGTEPPRVEEASDEPIGPASRRFLVTCTFS